MSGVAALANGGMWTNSLLSSFVILLLAAHALSTISASAVYGGWDSNVGYQAPVDPVFPYGWQQPTKHYTNPGPGRYILAMTNQWYNSLVIFDVDDYGVLQRLDEVYTGGRGQPLVYDANNNNTGRNTSPLSSQGAVAVKEKDVFVVNAGDHTVSWLQFDKYNNLKYLTRARVAGVIPCSVAIHPELPLIAALSCGGSGRVTFFKYEYGKLLKIDAFSGESGSHNLGVTNGYINENGLLGRNEALQFRRGVAPSQVLFAPAGDALYVLVKSKGLYVYPIYKGRLQRPGILSLETDRMPAPFSLPFAFTTLPSQCRTQGSCVVFVSKAFDNGVLPPNGGGSVEPYRILVEQYVNVKFEKLSDVQLGTNALASCWAAYANGIVCVTNTASGTVTCLRNGRNPVELAEASTVPIGFERAAPVEVLMSPEGQFVFALTPQSFNPEADSDAFMVTLTLDDNGMLKKWDLESLGDLEFPTGVEGAVLYIDDDDTDAMPTTGTTMGV